MFKRCFHVAVVVLLVVSMGLPGVTALAASLSGPAAPPLAGGPDAFGYTWDDTEAYSWVDATGGTDSGLSGDDNVAGPFDLGFSFPFYENTYAQVYVSTNGLLTFGSGSDESTNLAIPNPLLPDNYIAPLWMDLIVSNAQNPDGKVYLLQGGTAPNRYFVIEWYQIHTSFPRLTFEVILYENGDVVMQYQSISLGLETATIGIEDSSGYDGLQYDAANLIAGKAIRFKRPVSAARPFIYPPEQSGFSHPGNVDTFQFTVENRGEQGTDTFNLDVVSPWSVSFFDQQGHTLSDTNGDGKVDTGSLAPGDLFTFTVRVQTPLTATLGQHNTVALTATSSLDTSRAQGARLETAVPSAFAQALVDSANGAMSLDLILPNAQATKKVTADSINGLRPALAVTPDGNLFYAWRTQDQTISNVPLVIVSEIRYVLVSPQARLLHPLDRIEDLSNATVSTWDDFPAVAVAPDGSIGLLWRRLKWDGYLFNSNLYFAVLDSTGTLTYGPVSVTNNTAWGAVTDINVPFFETPQIAATSDNHFVLAWSRRSRVTPTGTCLPCEVMNVYTAVRDTAGNVVQPPTQFTPGAPGGTRYFAPGLAGLNDQVLLGYLDDSHVYYGIVNSSGISTTLPISLTTLTQTKDIQDPGPAAVQLSSGNTVIAWSDDGTIYFAVLDASFHVSAGPTALSKPALSNNDAVSATRDGQNHAVLTWMDKNNAYRLFYALVDANGQVITPPVVFHTTSATNSLDTSTTGYGNAPYLWTPPSSVDAWIAPTATLTTTPQTVAVRAEYGNKGVLTSFSAQITATLSGLSYVSATPAPASVSGDQVVWNLAQLSFLDRGEVWIEVMPTSLLASDIAWTIATTEPDAAPEDNTATTTLVVDWPKNFLPLIMR